MHKTRNSLVTLQLLSDRLHLLSDLLQLRSHIKLFLLSALQGNYQMRHNHGFEYKYSS
jgi:hypothetical protein